MLRGAIWFEYEKGILSQAECYVLIALEFSLPLTDVTETFRAVGTSVQADISTIRILQNIKEHTGIRLIVMSNIPEPDWKAFEHTEPEAYNLLDEVFTSAAAGERKPNLAFYHYVLHTANINPHRTLFIDDNVENVLSAKSLGMQGLLATTSSELASSLTTLLRNPVLDAKTWLQAHAKNMWSITDSGVIIKENFSQLLLMEVTGEPGLADVILPKRLSNFFRGKLYFLSRDRSVNPSLGEGILTTSKFPDDMDTTSIACTILDHFTTEVKHDIMDEILSFRNQDGIIQTYFDKSRPRIGLYYSPYYFFSSKHISC